MFETENFKAQLTDITEREGRNRGLTQYEPSIISFLQNLAIANENELTRLEERRSFSERRGVPAALTSAREVLSLATAYAVNDKRKIVTRTDVEMAYRAKFCQIWPFCK